jgi:formate hydrogenlyase transcriptional activator
MGTNSYQRLSLAHPVGLELGSAKRLAKWPIPGRAINVAEIQDTREQLDRAIQQPAGRADRSLPARFESLLSVSAAIGTHHDIEGLFSALATELLRVVDFDFLGISRYEETTGRVDWHLSRRDGGVEHGKIDGTQEEAISAWVYQHQKPLLIPALDGETRLHGKIEILAEEGLRSLCALPLTCGQQRIGCFLIGSKRTEVYSEDEVRFLSLIADMTASAVAGAMNFEALRKAQTDLESEKDRLRLLLELNNQIVSNLQLRPLLRAVSASVRRVMQCDAAGVHLPDSESRQLQLYALDFPQGRGLLKEDSRVLIDGCSCRRPAEVFRTRRPMLIGQLGLEPVCTSDSCITGVARPAEGLESACVLPLVSHDQVLGVLELGRRRGPAFTQADVDFLVQVTSQIAIAIENALAYEKITELKNKLAREKLYLEDEIRNEKGFEEIIGHSAAIRAVLKNIETVAPTDSTVLIYG